MLQCRYGCAEEGTQFLQEEGQQTDRRILEASFNRTCGGIIKNIWRVLSPEISAYTQAYVLKVMLTGKDIVIAPLQPIVAI